MSRSLHSEQIDLIATALAKAQGEIKGASKDSTNPHFKSKFATLNSHWDSCRDVLSKNGLMVTQLPTIEEDGKNVLVTILAHSSGQWFKSYFILNPVKNDPQGMGSCLTYAKRYMLSAIVGTTADDDDDGDSATNRKPEPMKTAPISDCLFVSQVLSKCPEEYIKTVQTYLKNNNFTFETMPIEAFYRMKEKVLKAWDDFLTPKQEENNQESE